MEVQIQKFETHYRLPYWAMSERRRLEQAKAHLLDQAFEQALAKCGVPEEAELCIRNLFVPVRVRLNGSDAEISAEWSAAIAAEIIRAIGKHATANTVFYESRRHALLDMAISLSRGDLSRAWAWRQLGLWRSSHTSEAQAIFELLRALCETATLIVPTLRALAHAGQLETVAQRFSETDWQELALAALDQAGFVHLLQKPSGVASTRALRDAWRVLRSSQLVRALTASVSLIRAGEPTRRALAVMFVMEAEPALLFSETAPAVIAVITDAIASTRNEMITDETTSPGENSDSVRTAARDKAKVDAASPKIPYDALAGEKKLESGAFDVDERPPFDASTPEAPLMKDASEGKRKDEEIDPIINRREAEPIVPDGRRRALTQFAGLLFLLGVVEDLKLPEEILADTTLGARPFLWVAHQLALRLQPMDERDPAALAFAGLPPDARPPSEGEDAPNENETRALNALVLRVVNRLSLLLEFDDDLNMSLMEFVCKRRAEIVADPGWIEVRFALDEVTTEIRRAGLDLNPGYVPWLGVVVVFVYE